MRSTDIPREHPITAVCVRERAQICILRGDNEGRTVVAAYNLRKSPQIRPTPGVLYNTACARRH